MPTITEYYDYAKLATAAYVQLESVGTAGNKLAEAANAQSRLPTAIANLSFDNESTEAKASGQAVWTIPTRPNPNNPSGPPLSGYYGNDGTGFAATLFEKDGKKVLAIRGTEPVGIQLYDDLLVADLGQIGFMGFAFKQTVSMINLLLRLQAPAADTAVRQWTWRLTTTPPANGDLAIPIAGGVTYLQLRSSFSGQGLGFLDDGKKITVTGHSLGGHLAAMAARLFPGLIDAAYTYNAPGFDPSAAQATALVAGAAALGLNSAMLALGTLLGGAQQLTDEFVGLIGPYLPVSPTSSFSGLNLYNVEGEDSAPGDDNSVVAGVITNAGALGQKIDVTTEGNSHLIEPLTDNLAVHALLYQLNNALTLAETNRILESASARLQDSDEKLVDALRKILVSNSQVPAPLPETYLEDTRAGVTTIGRGAIDKRQPFHAAILEIQNAVKGKPAIQLVSLLDKSADEIRALAENPDALATRYALKELNPFAVLGDNSLYTKFNINHELDLYSAATGKGLSDQWIEDRAKFLAAANTARSNDSVSGTTLVANPTAADSMLYKDLLLGIAVRNGQTVLDSQRITFGSEFGDTLKGGNKSDRLYGAAGADTLTGNAGADHLEGGSGDDVLHGGAGSDTYWIGRDGGTDTVLDSDGQGRIVLNGTTLEGTLTRDATDRGRYHYTPDPDLVIRYIGAEGMKGNLVIVDPRGDKAKVMVMDWASGELGLTLSNTPATPIVRPLTLAGDLLPIDHDISTPEENLGYDVLGNVDVTLTAAPNRADTLYGSAGNDLIQAKGGDDVLAGRAGEDRLEGSDGVDILDGGADNDLLIGGLAADLLGGGTGDDRLFADAEIELADIDLQTGGSGRELLAGGEGNDILAGAATADALLGGAGDDVILGGAGDDDILGDRHVTIAGNDTAREWSLTRAITPEGDITRYRHTYANFSSSGEAAESGADVLYGGGGNDWIFAGAGDDLLDGEADNDILFGEAGHDVLDGGAGDDIMSGDALDENTPDSLAGTLHGADWLDGGDGADTLTGNGGADELYGGTGHDQLAGDDTTTSGQYHGADYLDGEDGNDRLWGNGGEDSLFGGVGNDHLEGDESRLAGQYHGADYLDGEAGDDGLIGGGGNDTLYGGTGDDVLAGDDTADAPLAANHHGNDLLDGGEGWDSLYGNGGDDTMEDSGGPPTTRDSRRWRYGDSKSRSANQDAWRAAA